MKKPKPTIDGRTLRNKGRSIQFATHITPETKKRIVDICCQRCMTMTEVIEMLVQEYTPPNA